ncbi:peptide chain release factor 1 [Dehalococcoidia bacterium]|jgi:peptide chain release factor 1|nr:peptide chain release factor 1 [Dehalococcoidia bacterium]
MMEKLASVERRYREIEALLADPEVSSDYTRVEAFSKELASLKDLAYLSREYREVHDRIEEAREIIKDGSDQDLAELALEEMSDLENKRAQIEEVLKIALLPKDINDEKDVMIEIRAGAGGVEASLFAADLFRMYSRYAQRQSWRTEVMNSTEGEQGGIKELVLRIKGKGAYSRLKHESGGHRVQRIPVTESSGRIHTSAATVAVLAEAEDVDVDIKSDDLQIDIFHSSGHGGQNVQKVATAVRITHLPTRTVAVCQDERSQLKNKEKAMAVLRTRVLAKEIERQQQEISQERRSQVGSGDRSDRVRTYNFPQDRVTDHRVSLTSHNMDQILDGDIDQFIDALTTREQERLLEEAGI